MRATLCRNGGGVKRVPDSPRKLHAGRVQAAESSQEGWSIDADGTVRAGAMRRERAPGGFVSGTPLREGFADLPGVRVWHLDTGGRGSAVVLMHAATGSSRVWEHQLPALTGAGHRVVAHDRRGWGRSVVDPSGPQAGTAADDLRALADHLELDRFHLVGTAAGGIAALDFALSFPERLRSLVVANSIGGVQDDDYLALGRRLRPPEFEALPPDLRELGPSYRAAEPEGTRRWLELERLSRPTGARAPAQPTRHRLTFALLETLAVPTLLLTG